MIGKNIRYALRMLRKNPCLTASVVSALVACYVPARRAAAVGAVSALRIE